MNHKELLIKYMMIVVNHEGWDYLIEASEKEFITDSELAELSRISIEAKERLDVGPLYEKD